MLTKGDLIVTCIKMIENVSEQLDPNTISENTEHTEITMNIVESYNRAMNEVANARKLPRKLIVLTPTLGDKGKVFTRYNLDNIDIPDFENDVFAISKIIYENDNDSIYNQNEQVVKEGNNTLILPNITEGKYIVTYYPKFKNRMAYTTPDTEELNIPEEILDIISYFIKGELFEEDDTDRAVMSTQKFYALLGKLNTNSSDIRHSTVSTIYNQVY